MQFLLLCKKGSNRTKESRLMMTTLPFSVDDGGCRLIVSWIFAVLVFSVACTVTNGQQVQLNCAPCIQRSDYHIRAVVHGVKSASFWQQVRSAALQAAKDLRVELIMDLYDVYDAEQMARDVRKVLFGSPRPDALIVTIPSEEVAAAVRDVVRTGFPVFGMNSGYQVAADLGVLGFVALEEYMGGREASKEFLARRNVTRALFVNHEKGNTALEERFQGFRDGLLSSVNSTDSVVVVDEFIMKADDAAIEASLSAVLGESCGVYDAILLGGSVSLVAVTQTLYGKDCPLNVDQSPLVGTFDVDTSVYDAIAVGKVAFAISQQNYLQGSLAVFMATLYASTGKKLAPSADSDFGVYFSGPAMTSLGNLPSDTVQMCQSDAFPVCPNTLTPDGSRESNCACTKRQQIKIGGVVHGVTTDTFWDQVYAASFQAADDMGVELDFPRFDPQASDEVLHAKMANKMISLCQEGIAGLFVSIPTDAVISAIQTCLNLNVPVVSINSGSEAAVSLGLKHHIAQIEYQAGKGAGQRLIASGMTRGACVNHVPGLQVLTDRCNGLRDAIEEAGDGVTYLGEIDVPFDSSAQFKMKIKSEINEAGDWEGVGLLLLSPDQVRATLEIQEDHPKLLIASFDTSSEIFDAIEAGKLLHGIDQEPYLQGYMPVILLTWSAYTAQSLINVFIESGPKFVDSAPSMARQVCESNMFEVCPEVLDYEYNLLNDIRPAGLALFSVAAVTSLGMSVWVAYNRKTRVVKSSQPFFLVMICVGTLIMASSIIPMGVDDGVASIEGCNMACMSIPWLFFVGFTVAFSALFSKTWRINRLMAHAQRLRRVRVLPRDVILPFVILLVLNLALLVTWTLVDPIYWDRRSRCGSSELETYGACTLGENGSVAIASTLVALNMFLVLLANIQAYQARRINMEFNESKYIGFVMVSIMQISIIGFPVMFLVTENPQATYFVRVGLIFVLCMSTLLLIFVPKIIHLRKANKRSEQRRMDISIVGAISRPSNVTTCSDAGLRVFTLNEGNRESTAKDTASFSDSLPDKIIELEQLMEEQGIQSEPLFQKVGIKIENLRRRRSSQVTL